MTDQEFIDGIKYACENNASEFADRILAIVTERITASMQFDTEAIVKTIDSVIHRLVREHFQKSVANEVGNRLRCGIYDGTKVDDLFEAVWKKELDKAIEERISGKIDKAIDAVIAKRLKSLK